MILMLRVLAAVMLLAIPLQGSGIVYAYTVMAVGDSITDGFGSSNGYGYLPYLEAGLAPGFQFVGTLETGTPYPHSGYGGYTTTDFLVGTPPLIETLSTMTPDIMLLHIGTNDIAGAFIGNVNGNDPLQTYTNVLSMLDSIWDNSPGTYVYLAQIIPFSGEFEGGNGGVQDFNNRLSNGLPGYLAGHPGFNVQLVDMYAVLDLESYYSDGLHPNDSGYEKMGEAWATAINPVPIPAPVFLLAGGLAGLAAIRKRFLHCS